MAPNNFVSYLTLTNASFLDTGLVECFYNETSHPVGVIPKKDVFYLFVNSKFLRYDFFFNYPRVIQGTNYSLLPCSLPGPFDACKMPSPSPRRGVPIYLENFDDFIPCKPTDKDLTVMAVSSSSNDAYSIDFDPSKGFQLRNISDTPHYVQCHAKGHEEQICLYTVNYDSVVPKCSMRFNVSHHFNDILSAENFTLLCEVECPGYIDGVLTITPPSSIKYTVNSSSIPWIPGSPYLINSEAVFYNSSATDSGTYSCLFSPNGQSVQERQLELIIRDPSVPSFVNTEIETNIDITKVKGENETLRVILNCHVIGVPVPSFIWYFENEEIINYNVDEIVASSPGTYLCVAFNIVGSVNRTFTLKTESNQNIAGWIAGIVGALMAGIVLTVIGLGLFSYFRIRRRNRNINLEEMWDQYFGQRNNGLQFQGFDYSTNTSPPTISTSVIESSSSLNSPSSPVFWLADNLEQVPYNNIYEIEMEWLNLKAVLGRGAFGVVFEGELSPPTAQQRQKVAVKAIRDSYDLEQYAALCSEIKLLAAIGYHVNICNIVGAVTKSLQNGVVCLVIEYCPGGNLRDFLHFNQPRFVDTLEYDYFTMPQESSLVCFPFLFNAFFFVLFSLLKVALFCFHTMQDGASAR